MGGRNPAPPKNRWGDASPANTNPQWFAMVSKWCERISSTGRLLAPMPSARCPALWPRKLLAAPALSLAAPRQVRLEAQLTDGFEGQLLGESALQSLWLLPWLDEIRSHHFASPELVPLFICFAFWGSLCFPLPGKTHLFCWGPNSSQV